MLPAADRAIDMVPVLRKQSARDTSPEYHSKSRAERETDHPRWHNEPLRRGRRCEQRFRSKRGGDATRSIEQQHDRRDRETREREAADDGHRREACEDENVRCYACSNRHDRRWQSRSVKLCCRRSHQLTVRIRAEPLSTISRGHKPATPP